ncbi:MAG: UDP binding domain-containing protein, partial [Anaerolineales bacterium]
NFKLTVYDQEAIKNIKNIFKNQIYYSSNPYQAIDGKDGLIILTEWNEFKQLDLERLSQVMRQRVIFDGRNIYQPQTMKALGFIYRGMGRGVNPHEGA